MRAEVERTIRRERLLAPGAPVHVAVSGGIDSMVLLHVLHALGHPCTVLHVDHGLRGEQSAADARFVQEEAARMGLPFRMRHVQVRTGPGSGGASVQMAARNARRDALRAMMDPRMGPCALAHHADDAVETLFIHLLRGTGLRGWAAIPPRSGPFIRPLINMARSDIAAYAVRHRIPHREDPGNADTRHLRNRIRHQLLPLLEDMRPGARRTMARSVNDLRHLVDMALTGPVEASPRSVPLGPGAEAWSLEPLKASAVPMAILARWLRPYAPHPDVVAHILDAIMEQRIGALFTLGDRSLVVDRDRLVVATGHRPAAYPFHLDDPAGHAGPLAWRIEEGAHIPVGGPHEAVFPLKALEGPLMLRPWRRGDRMRPAGLGGSKLVSDLLTEARVPRNLKDRAYVLLSGDRIIWLVGHRVAEGLEVDAAPGSAVRFRWSG